MAYDKSGFGPGWRLPPSPIGLPSSWGSCRPFQGTREEGHKEILCRANCDRAQGYRRPSIHYQKAPASERALPYALTRRHASERAPPLAPSPTRRCTSEQGTADDAEAPSSALPSTPSSHKRVSTIVRPAANSSSRQWASTVVRPAADLPSLLMMGVDQALLRDQSNNNGSRPPTLAGVNQAAKKNNLYEGL